MSSSNKIDLSGKQFGRLLVLGPTIPTKNGHTRWVTRCVCGEERVVTGYDLRSGHTKSCGCLQDDSRRKRRLKGDVVSFRRMVSAYKLGARKRNLEWQLSDIEVRYLAQQPCHYCGSLPSNVAQKTVTHEPFVYNGIDRVDSSRGYTLDNVVSCCAYCNRAKLNRPVEEFREWLIRVAMYYGGL